MTLIGTQVLVNFLIDCQYELGFYFYILQQNPTPAPSPSYIAADQTETLFSCSSVNEPQSPVPSNCTAISSQATQTSQVFGLEFTHWFYTMLNTLQDFEPKHFWSTCCLRVEAIGDNPILQEAINDAEECCKLLRSLVELERIVFTPNVLNGLGVSCVIDSYGLAQVKVAGTIQVLKPELSIPGGVFDQLFGLVKDTLDNNYKIKYSVLRLRAATNVLEFAELSNAIMNTPVVIEDVTDTE